MAGAGKPCDFLRALGATSQKNYFGRTRVAELIVLSVFVFRQLGAGSLGLRFSHAPESLMKNRLVICTSKVTFWIFICVVILVISTPSQAMEQLTSGTSSKQARQQALQSVPYNQLNQQTRTKIREVLEKPSIYRRLPITEIDIESDYFVFLVRHPEVIVNIWQIMGITQMKAERIGPFELRTDDGQGAASDVELVYGSENTHIYYATGSYEGPILKKKILGRCVMILRTEYQRGSDGASRAKCSLDVFLKVDNTTASLVAKTLNPIVGTTADHNFVESLNFLQRLNETTEKNGAGVQRMAGRLRNINPQVRGEFVKLAGQVYQRHAHLKGAPSTRSNSSYPVQPSSFQAAPYPSVTPMPGSHPTTINPSTMPYPATVPLRQSGTYRLNGNVRYPYYQMPQDQGVQKASYWSSQGGPAPRISYPRQRFLR